MSDPRFEPPRQRPDVDAYRPLTDADDDYRLGKWDWMPVAIAGVIIAAIVVFALAVPENTQQASNDRPAITTDTTTGRAPPRQ